MERRKFIRIESDLLIWYQTIYEEGDFSFGKEPSANISAGGIQLEMEDIDAVGTKMVMKFRLPGLDREIQAKGKVVWAKRLSSGKHSVGIQFFEIAHEDMQAINNFAIHSDKK